MSRTKEPALPAIPGRTVVSTTMSLDGCTVSWTDDKGDYHQSPLADWLALVPPYKSTYPYGNKVADEAAEVAHGQAMRYWNDVAHPPRQPAPPPATEPLPSMVGALRRLAVEILCLDPDEVTLSADGKTVSIPSGDVTVPEFLGMLAETAEASDAGD
jgi:hypothetical protein